MTVVNSDYINKRGWSLDRGETRGVAGEMAMFQRTVTD